MTARLSLPRERIRVLLLEAIHERAAQVFERAGYTAVERLDRTPSPDDLRAALADAHVVGLRSRTQLDAAALAHAPKLLAVGCFCIGTDQVALDAAALRAVPVFNAPHSNTRSVAELVIGLAVMLFRDVFHKSAAAHAGHWLKTAAGCHEVRGKTIGIVGYGHIGSQVSVLAEAMGLHVVYHDIVPKLSLGNARALPTLDDVLAVADLVTLHVPETPETRGLFDAERLAKMRPGAYLVNASRGSVVDVDALAALLRTGRLGGAAVDVFPREPKGAGEEFTSALRGVPNAILTPHVGGSTVEAQEAIAVEVASKLVAYSDTGATIGAVNFPELSLAPHAGCQRVLHVHENRPGVLRAINELFAARGVNVVGQHLQTRGAIGYVALDVETGDAAELLPALREVPGTVRARVLY